MNEAALLQGAANFRAVKPYPAAGGRRLKANTLFRSGELSRLNAEDLRIVESLGIRLVCDLRTDREQAEYISRWPENTGHARLDWPDRDVSDAGPQKIFELIAQYPGELGALKAMERLYRRKPRAYVASLGSLFDTILAGGALPLLIHCHAGKDRTGFVMAMLLAAAGLDRKDIFDDYVTTAKFFPIESEARALAAWAQKSFGHVVHPESAVPMVDARRAYIEAAFAEVDASWGGVEGYLYAAGLNEGKQARLRDMLTA